MIQDGEAKALVVVASDSARKGGRNIKLQRESKSKLNVGSTQVATKQPPRLRAWDCCASRAVKRKLGSFPASQVNNNKDASGKLILGKVVDESMKLKPHKMHISPDFWARIIKDHHLRGGFASDLPEPETEEVVDKELNACLSQCHCSNPDTLGSKNIALVVVREFGEPH